MDKGVSYVSIRQFCTSHAFIQSNKAKNSPTPKMFVETAPPGAHTKLRFFLAPATAGVFGTGSVRRNSNFKHPIDSKRTNKVYGIFFKRINKLNGILRLFCSSQIRQFKTCKAGRYSSVGSDLAWESRGTAIDLRVRKTQVS